MRYNRSPIDPSKELVDMAETQVWLRIKSRNTIYDWLNEDSPRFKNDFPPPFKIGSRLRWYKEDVARFIDSCASAEGNSTEDIQAAHVRVNPSADHASAQNASRGYLSTPAPRRHSNQVRIHRVR